MPKTFKCRESDCSQSFQSQKSLDVHHKKKHTVFQFAGISDFDIPDKTPTPTSLINKLEKYAPEPNPFEVHFKRANNEKAQQYVPLATASEIKVPSNVDSDVKPMLTLQMPESRAGEDCNTAEILENAIKLEEEASSKGIKTEAVSPASENQMIYNVVLDPNQETLPLLLSTHPNEILIDSALLRPNPAVTNTFNTKARLRETIVTNKANRGESFGDVTSTVEFSSNKRSSSEESYKELAEKRQKYLERNREAASRCRQKKKEYYVQLESKNSELIKELKAARLQITQLRQENANLKSMLLKIKGINYTTSEVREESNKFS